MTSLDNPALQPVGPIFVAHLFAELHQLLVALLRGLEEEQWESPTVCGSWTVRDVAAHLLDGDLRRLSFQRDGLPLLQPDEPITGYHSLLRFLDQLNADWVRAARRLSPAVLIAMLELSGRELAAFFQTLDPYAISSMGVAWAGEDTSPNWFDLAREYTEKWMHQQHIRDAVGLPGIDTQQLMYPVLDTFMRALPHAYRNTNAMEGATILFTIAGPAGGVWSLRREGERWQLYHGGAEHAEAHITLGQDTAWRIFTKGLDIKDARARVEVRGDERLAGVFLQTVAIMA